jgi:hypothetical protein
MGRLLVPLQVAMAMPFYLLATEYPLFLLAWVCQERKCYLYETLALLLPNQL